MGVSVYLVCACAEERESPPPAARGATLAEAEEADWSWSWRGVERGSPERQTDHETLGVGVPLAAHQR